MRSDEAPDIELELHSVYGRVNAGVRARLLQFAERAGAGYRLHTFFPEGEARSHSLTTRPFQALRAERQARHRHQAGRTVMIRREISPFSKGGLEARYLTEAAHGVYDIDDALPFDRRGAAFELFFSKAATAAMAASAADVVVAGNAFLANWADGLAARVEVIPTCVELSDYAQKEDYELHDPPRILWLGTATGERYLNDIWPALEEVQRRHGAEVTLISNGRQRRFPFEDSVNRVPWSLRLANTSIASYDIGIMPLRNSLFEKGKCAYKLLQYGAAGLPAIASPIGVNEIIQTRASGLGPRNHAEWIDSLDLLIVESASSRRSRAEKLRKVVAEEFTFDAWQSTWESVVGL